MNRGTSGSLNAMAEFTTYSVLRALRLINRDALIGWTSEIAALLVLVVAIVVFGNWHFGGFDQSVIVGAGYRFWEGQQPYRDFVMTVPVLFYVGAGLAFFCFGVSWLALICATAAYAAMTYVGIMWGLKRLGLSRSWAIAVAFTAEAMSMVLVAYWWYNPITAIAVAMFLVSTLVVLRQSGDWPGWLAWTGAAALVALAKPNSAGVVLAGSGLAFALRPSARKPFLRFSCLAVVIDLVILDAISVSPREVVASYVGAAGRGLPSLERFVQDTPPDLLWLAVLLIAATLLPWVCGTLAAAAAAGGVRIGQPRLPGRLPASEWILFTSGAVAGTLAFFTNGEIKAADLPMLFMPVALSTLLREPASTRWKNYLLSLMVLLSLTGFVLGANRARVRLIGPGAFYQLPAWGGFGWYAPFFEHLREGYNLHAVMAATSELMAHLRTRAGPRPKVFFGPRMEFNYAVHSIESPRGLPLFWHEGVGYPAHLRGAVVNAFRSNDFDLCIFLRGDFTYMPAEILSCLEADYHRFDTHALTIFCRDTELVPGGFDNGPRLMPACLDPTLGGEAGL